MTGEPTICQRCGRPATQHALYREDESVVAYCVDFERCARHGSFACWRRSCVSRSTAFSAAELRSIPLR